MANLAGESTVRTDILPDSLTEEQTRVKLEVGTIFNTTVDTAERYVKTRTPYPAKNIIEVMDLIKQAIDDYSLRTHKTADAGVTVTYQDPDVDAILETISMSLVDRNPGAFSQGPPNRGKVKNLRPILRETRDDPDHPGYQRAVLGYFYDNTLQLTCWARTNKQANERALWLENVMEEYTWWFARSGVNRIIYDGRPPERKIEVHNNKIYGRPMNYFVRTEKLRSVSQKELEQVYIRLSRSTT